ncbi:hypothetical protein N7508_008382 [Penicillium antarcticum]|nr:uncharacterized protein N7508_008382 [Penicillium antarcticum]KAJ5293561.1 hypothetical protein N7508_008382 [Penicillium antarcticum]
MVRKCISFFGAGNIPHLDIGVGGLVEVDSAFHIHLVSARDFQNSVTPQTWSLAHDYAADLKERGVKIAIFSATPQGEAIANTRHALLRFSHCLGTDIRWYVPDPAPRVCHSIEKMQRILQGISSPEEHITTDEELQLLNWVYKNAKHHWLCHNGPLRRAQEGGVDIVIIDDPFLSALALISKQHSPKRPVVFHSRMNIHIDPAASAGDARTEVFDFIWRTLRHVDILACQAPSKLKSRLIPEDKVFYTLATVDKFDGRNKDMKNLDLAFYGRQFNASYLNAGTSAINYPEDEYILVELARSPSFQQAATVLDAYKELCILIRTSSLQTSLPKLLFCDRQTHGYAVEEFSDFVASQIALKMNDLGSFISVKQVKPPDQLWNTLLSKAAAVILLSDTEGFEERFLEAVQKGKPVIRTESLGPYRSLVENDKNVFTVSIADANSMARHLFKIWVDGQLQQQGKSAAPNKTWDEITTVGNAVNWLFLASKLSKGETIKPSGEYIYHLAQQDKAKETEI